MKIAIYRRSTVGEERGARAEEVVLAMLRAMVRREPATPVIAAIDGGAVGAWIEGRDRVDTVVEAAADGSFALGDGLMLRPADAAALLAAVRERGEGAFPDLDGAFAAVVHDARARRTWVLTDRFATRPLYAFDDGRTYACASEAKALFAVPGIEPREDPLAIYDLLNFGYLIGERTWFEGIALLPETTAVLLAAGRRPERRRYRSRLFEAGTLSERDGLEAVGAAFEKACRDLGRRARRPAMLLSGGLDSRTISAFCARAGIPLTCYTFGPRRSGETTGAQGIANALGYPIERCEVPVDLLPRRAALAEWIGDGHLSLADVHFLDHHVHQFGPDHGAFFDGWLGGVIGGAYYVKDSDLQLESKAQLADSIQAQFDFQHPVPLEDDLYEPGFAKRLRERARESVTDFLGDWDLERRDLAVAKEAASLRFRDRRWQLFHNGIVAEPFTRGLRPFIVGDLVERFQALPLESRMHAGFYQKLIVRHFPRVAAVAWHKTGRAIGQPPSAAIDKAREWKRLAFYYLGRLSGGAINVRDLTKYNHYDQNFREHESVRDYFAATIDRDAPARAHLKAGGAARLLEAERKGGRYFEILARLLQAELTRRLFFDAGRDAARASLVPEKLGPVRLRGDGDAAPVRLGDFFRKEFLRPEPKGNGAAPSNTAEAA